MDNLSFLEKLALYYLKDGKLQDGSPKYLWDNLYLNALQQLQEKDLVFFGPRYAAMLTHEGQQRVYALEMQQLAKSKDCLKSIFIQDEELNMLYNQVLRHIPTLAVESYNLDFWNDTIHYMKLLIEHPNPKVYINTLIVDICNKHKEMVCEYEETPIYGYNVELCKLYVLLTYRFADNEELGREVTDCFIDHLGYFKDNVNVWNNIDQLLETTGYFYENHKNDLPAYSIASVKEEKLNKEIKQLKEEIKKLKITNEELKKTTGQTAEKKKSARYYVTLMNEYYGKLKTEKDKNIFLSLLTGLDDSTFHNYWSKTARNDEINENMKEEVKKDFQEKQDALKK